MREWFHHLATVEQEIRFDVERFETRARDARGVRGPHPDPSQAGDHSGREDAARARRPMRPTRVVGSRRSCSTTETEIGCARNIDAGRWLLDAALDCQRTTAARPGITVIGPVDSQLIIGFLDGYRFHENSRDLNGRLISDYIKGRRSDGELTHFKIAVMGRSHRFGLSWGDRPRPAEAGRLHQPRASQSQSAAPHTPISRR